MYRLKELKIPKDEVLRYLGYRSQELGRELDELIESTIIESKVLISPKFTFGSYNISGKEEGVHVEGTNLVLKGEDIKNHLKYAKECVLMAVTIGGNIEKKINLYEKTNLTKALILDACGTTAVEEVCDQIEGYVKGKANKKGESITFRYSPGYGDLPLDIQKDLVNVIRGDRTIGLTVSSHNLLFPRKSVTAIIGLVPMDKEIKERGCEVCKNYKNCTFRKGGIVCGT